MRRNNILTTIYLSTLLTLLLVALAPSWAQDAPKPTGGVTLIDPLQMQAGEIRTLPQVPKVGVWSLLIGNPGIGAQGRGVAISKNGQACVYPANELLVGKEGTIRFIISATPAPVDAVDAERVLLDTWPNPSNGAARIRLLLKGKQLQLTLTSDNKKTSTIEATVNWPDDSLQTITIRWNADALSLLINNQQVGTAAKPEIPKAGPLAVVFGNDRDYKFPSFLTVSDIIFSTSSEPINQLTANQADELIPNDELMLKMAQGYQRRIDPVLEILRNQRVSEVDYARALQYSDTGDIDRAMQTIKPIAADVNHPLYVQAVFLRSDLLVDQKNYLDAYDQLQVLVGNKDLSVSVSARVKQAKVLYDSGNTAEAKRLIGEIIAQYTDIRDVNVAYLMIGLDYFRLGNFDAAFRAFDSIGLPGAPARLSVAIGTPLQIKVADADLNARLTDAGLPVTIVSNNGDTEELLLRAAFSRGVYTGAIETSLGVPVKGDGILQVQGGTDEINISYVDRLSSEGANIPRKITIQLRTDAKLILLAQSAVDIYREVLSYQKLLILDDRWEVIGKLPPTASAFFRNPEDGLLRLRGYRFNSNFLTTVKPGQSVFIEINEPDEDRTPQADTITANLTTRTGTAMAVKLTETGPRTGIFTAVVKCALKENAGEGVLAVEINDTIIARFEDLTPASGTTDRLRESRVAIRAMDGTISVGMLLPDRENQQVFVKSYRVQPKSPVIIVVEDRDLDNSDVADTITVKAVAASGATMEIKLTETGTHTGVFMGPLRIDTAAAPNSLLVVAGDTINISYNDVENSTNIPKDRVVTLKTNIAENVSIKFFRQHVVYPDSRGADARILITPPKITWEETTVLQPGSVYRVLLTDPDIIPTTAGDFWTTVSLRSTNKAAVDVGLRGGVDHTTHATIFQGEFYVRLGDENSPVKAFFSQTGAVMEMKEEEAFGVWTIPAINVQGKDTVESTYIEPVAANGATNVALKQQLRIAYNGEIDILNLQGNPLEDLKPGMSFEIQITDANGDLTIKRDTISAVVSSSAGDARTIEFSETDIHSGVFSAMLKTVFGEAPVVDELLQVPFSGLVTITYNDVETVLGTASPRTAEIKTRPLEDADGILVTKIFDDPKFEVETLVRLGESMYALGAAELSSAPKTQPRTNAKLQMSARLLQQVIDRFPTSEYIVESLFLTARIYREEQKFDLAQRMFTRVVEDYPESDFVPQALYQLVLLHYDQNNIAAATESAMQLIYGFPKNALVADAFLHIAEFYYNKKEFLTSAYIYSRVVDRFPDNERIALIHYRMATSYFKAATASTTIDNAAMNSAIRYYLEFEQTYPEHELADDSLFWAAQCYNMRNDAQRAYTLVSKLLITYSAGDMKNYAARLRDQIKAKNPTIEAEPF